MAKGIGPVKLTRADQKILKSYIPTLQGLAAYLGSSYEIVLHSLEDYDHSVIGIINGEHTGRKIGAPITDLALDMLDELSAGGKASTVYFSRNKKGEPLKSTTIAVRGEHDRIIGLICINLYLNTSLCDILDGLTPGTVRARVMADDSILPSNKNKAIVEELDQKGMFRLKDSVVFVAEQLGISRNTIYMHLRNHRKRTENN